VRIGLDTAEHMTLLAALPAVIAVWEPTSCAGIGSTLKVAQPDGRCTVRGLLTGCAWARSSPAVGVLREEEGSWYRYGDSNPGPVAEKRSRRPRWSPVASVLLGFSR